MKIETVAATDSQSAYGKLIAIAMKQTQTSQRQLEKSSGVSRQRIAAIIRNGDVTPKEQDSIFTALSIDSLQAHIAVVQLRDPSAYFGAIAETIANFTHQLTTQLGKECEARQREFVSIRRNLLVGLVNDVTDRVIKHQDLSTNTRSQFLG
jgi:transcriptional regulator with XRE-family HTH domain